MLPGDPTDLEITWSKICGHPSDGTHEPGRARRLGLTNPPSELSDAIIELGCWRQRISALPPGPELVTELTHRPDRLAPALLTDPDQALQDTVTGRAAGTTDQLTTSFANAVLDSITARARVLAWLQAEQHTDLAMLSKNYPGLHEMLPTEVGFALRTSDATAGNMISLARAITTRTPGTLQALRDGLIHHDHAMAIARATSTTTPEIAAQVEADLLQHLTAPGSTITAEQLRRRAVRRVIKLDPDGSADRHRKAAADRRITRWTEEDGMAGMTIYAPAQHIAIIWETATTLAYAAKTPGDDRTLGNRRVDALTDLCADILDQQTRPGHHPGPHPANNAAGDTADQAGTRHESAHQEGADRIGADQRGTGRAGADQAGTRHESAHQEGADRVGADPAGADRAGADQAGADRAGTDPAGSNAEQPSSTTDITQSSTGGPVAAPCSTCGRPPDGATPTSSTAVLPKPPAALPKYHGQRPHIQVVIPYTVLLGGIEPCELVGHGAITADQARLIAADGILRRLVTDPLSGTLLDYGRTRYQPPETLKQFVITRDGTCQAPGCLQPAHRGQIDHVDAYRPGKPTGGKTNHRDLKNYCLHHHRAKDGGGFTNTLGPDGTSHWTTPLGRQYSRPPHQIWHPEDHETPESKQDLGDGFPAEREFDHRSHRHTGATDACDSDPVSPVRSTAATSPAPPADSTEGDFTDEDPPF